MTYTPYTWVAGTTTPLSVDNMNHLETQYTEAATYADAHHDTSKIVTGARQAASGSGDEVITGAGFTPKSIIVIASLADNTTYVSESMGFGDSALAEYCRHSWSNASTSNGNGSQASIIYLYCGTNYTWSAVLKTLDAAGCTLTFTKGSATAADCNYSILFM